MMTDGRAPAVSLLVPIYNVENYLRQCLDSAMGQTLKDIEVICVNDGSTDSSREIIQEYLDNDPRFRVIDKENSGYGSSMNKGLEAAKGEYVAILESDDFFEPDALEKLYLAAKEADADVAKADFNLYWSEPEERIERFGWVHSEEAGASTPLASIQVFYRKPSIWSAIYKRVFLEQNSISFLETPGASYQDAGFNFKVWVSAQNIVLLDEVVLNYRQDNEASSVNAPGKVYCVCDEYREMVRFLKTRPNEEMIVPVLVKMRYDSYMWNYDRLTEPLQREFILKMSEDFRHEDERGLTDYSLFESWKQQDRQLIISDPMQFHAQRLVRESTGKIDTAKRLYRVGGISMLKQALLNKIRNKG